MLLQFVTWTGVRFSRFLRICNKFSGSSKSWIFISDEGYSTPNFKKKLLLLLPGFLGLLLSS